MGSPRHLWTGEWRAESDQAREDGASSLRRTPPPRPTAEETDPAAGASRGGGAPRRGPTIVLAVLVAVLAIAAGGLAALMLLDGGDDGDGGGSPEPLAAADSRPLRPRVGETLTGRIYAAASPAVVSVRTTTGQGTGFVIEDDGTIVTNEHVVGEATHVVVKFGPDGASIDGDVLGTDPSTDLAVVSIESDRIPRGVEPLRFADSDEVAVGDLAVAIGNPFGLDRTATEGIISGLGRSITAPNGFEIEEVIQTDAPINPGNSGGPLLDDGGRVIGVNSQIATSSGTAGQGGNIGIGFAVPSNTAREIVPRLERGQEIPRPWLGVRTSPTGLMSSDGARVMEVTPRGPALRGGLRVDDVITRVGGRAVETPDDVAAGIAGRRPGDEIEIEVERDDRRVTLDVTLGDRSDAP